MEAQAKQAVGFEDSALEYSSTCFVSDPTRARVERRDVAAGAVKAQDRNEANSQHEDEEDIFEHHLVITGDT